MTELEQKLTESLITLSSELKSLFERQQQQITDLQQQLDKLLLRIEQLSE